MSEENVEIVRRLYDAVARRDTETVLSIYHPDLVWDHTHNRAVAGLVGDAMYHGHDGLRRWSREFYEAWRNVDAELEELVEVGDQVVVVLNYRGRGRVSGIEVEFTRMAGLITIRDRQVIEAVWFRDAEAAFAYARR